MKRHTLTAALAAALILASAMAALGAPVRVAQSGWAWGNPRPQGNDLTAIAVAGGRTFAVGANGTALRSDDGGATWQGLATGTTSDLATVQALTPNTIFVGGGCIAERSDDGGATFSRLLFTPSEASCRATLTDLSFPTAATGFLLLSDGSVEQSTGIDTFAQVQAVPDSGPGGAHATAIAFSSPTAGYALTSASSGGKLYRTVDGAGSWTLAASASGGLNDIAFPTPLVGYVAGDRGQLLRTLDGGATWTATTVRVAGQPANLGSIGCASATTCMFATTDGRQFLRTTDGGATFSAVTPLATGTGVAFPTPARAVVIGAGGATKISDDAGVHFTPVGGALGLDLSGLVSGPGASAFATGAEGKIGRTLDGGATWSTVGVPNAGAIRSVSFPDPQDGYEVDLDGSVQKTVDAGAGWAVLDPGTSTHPVSVYATSAKDVWLLMPLGLRHSTNGGRTFAQVADRVVSRSRIASLRKVGSSLFAIGRATVLTSKGGKHWKKIKLPKRRGTVQAAQFFDPRHGYVLQRRGPLYSTANGGKRWTELPGLGTINASRLAFTSRRTGWTTAPNGTLLRTDDAGRTFRPQVIGPPIVSIVAVPGHAYALAPSGALFATGSSGDVATRSALTLRPSHTRLKHPGLFVTLHGTLKPGTSGEQVTLGERLAGSVTWKFTSAKVTGSGTFSARFKLRRGATFVARWDGAAGVAGAGTPAVSVSVGKARKK